jgi:hypothetical protein
LKARSRLLSLSVLLLAAGGQAHAVEAPTVAGPIGGTDARSAMIPPPGLYGGIAAYHAETVDFNDKNGNGIPALSDATLEKSLGAPFFIYVPKTTVLGGSVSVWGYVPVISVCGHLFAGTADQCDTGVGDGYVELDWGRSFARPRPSAYANAYPIFEGLTTLVGFGLVIPFGEYTAADPLSQAISPGSNIWDFAPTAGFTYTTAPILAEGTEISMRLYWNRYLENSETKYFTGAIINIDFAVTEHIGPLQIGVTGFFATQVADDELDGRQALPDGRQAEVFGIGGVAIYDLPQQATSLKLKATTTTPHAEYTVEAWAVTFSAMHKF